MQEDSFAKRQSLVLKCVIFITFMLSASFAWSEEVPGGTLNPNTIPKYVTPLVIPPVMPTNVPNSYNIAVREFKQQILPGGIWNSINNRNDKFNATRIWSYGPADDPLPKVAPDPNSGFNYPAYTIETISNVPVDVRWINGLVDEKGKYLNHLLPVDQTVHWANPPMDCRDGTVRTDCSGTSDDLYEGPVPIVTHLHGAHVDPHSDGYPEAWWLPAANNIPKGYATSGTIFDDADGDNDGTLGYADYGYRQDQPATTLWYHDHTLGMTRLNVYAGPAGFWLIRGSDVEGEYNSDPSLDNFDYDEVDDYSTGEPWDGTLPGPAPVAGQGVLELNVPDAPVRSAIREIPIVIQDRSFDKDGSLFYPKFRAFFEGIDKGDLKIDFASFGTDVLPHWLPEAFFNVMVVNGVSWPQIEVAQAQYRFRLLNGCNSRFLNLALRVVDGPGVDGEMGTADDVLGAEIPFYQIGADQGFLKQVVEIKTGYATKLPSNTLTKAPDADQALLMGLAERADVIVDFSELDNGTIVRMINTAPDEPFGGFTGDINNSNDEPAVADPGTSGQVMQFVVNNTLNGKSLTDTYSDAAKTLNPNAATTPQNLVLNAEGALAVADNIISPRKVSLNERESESVCVLLDLGDLAEEDDDAFVEPIRQVPCPADPDNPPEIVLENGNIAIPVPFGPTEALLGTVTGSGGGAIGNPLKWTDTSGESIAKQITLGLGANERNVTVSVSENPDVGDVEEWDIYNFTADAHPIHLHLVRFEVVKRTLFDGTASPNGTQQAWESGFKDTVIAYPGEITTVKAHFDVEGLYVWHCHIVEHEDNEMMRPYAVGLDDAE